MRAWIALTLIAIMATGCRTRPAPVGESVASSYYHSYGFPLSKEEWNSRGQSGKVVSNLKGGSIESISYENGLRHGTAEWTFPYSTIISRSCIYDQGRLTQEIDHYTTGSPKHQVNYLSNQEREVLCWYPDGVPQAKERWRNEELLAGEYYSHDGDTLSVIADGSGKRLEFDGYRPVAEESFSLGLIVVREETYPSKQVSARIPHQEGKIEGVIERFDELGALVMTEQWVGGKRQGLVTEYLNGEKIAEIPYVQGLKQGQEKRFRAGELVETLEWSSGKKLGAHKMYSGGQVIRVEYYYHDIPVSKVAYEKMVL